MVVVLRLKGCSGEDELNDHSIEVESCSGEDELSGHSIEVERL